MFGFFRKKEGEEEKDFWDWFIQNKSRIERFMDSDHSDYAIYNVLSAKIQNYNKFLFPELTKTDDGKYVLIITPDGRKDGVTAIKKLGESHPDLENWIVKKFRQPNDHIDLNFDGLEYPSSHIEIIPEIDSQKEVVNIQIFIRNMNRDPKKHQTLAFLYLDHILGEFNTITKVGYIDFHHLDDNMKVKDSITLLDLRKLIENELY